VEGLQWRERANCETLQVPFFNCEIGFAILGISRLTFSYAFSRQRLITTMKLDLTNKGKVFFMKSSLAGLYRLTCGVLGLAGS